MINYKTWREFTAPPVTNSTSNDVPTPEDFNFYQTKLSGNVKRYLQWLVQELEKSNGKMTLVRKGFIMQEVMDALGLNAAQVTRLSNNIKKGIMASHAAKQNQTDDPSASIR